MTAGILLSGHKTPHYLLIGFTAKRERSSHDLSNMNVVFLTARAVLR